MQRVNGATNYIIFQRPIKLKKDDDENADINGLYAERNSSFTLTLAGRIENINGLYAERNGNRA